MKVILFDNPGEPDVLRVGDYKMPKPGDDEVVIKVMAAGVNVEDIWRRYGLHWVTKHRSPILGHECSGFIHDIGKNVQKFRRRDSVCALLAGGGGYAEYVSVSASRVLKAPDSIDLIDAASLPQATCLVTLCFRVLSCITPQKKILIYGAAGGVGVIAIQFAKFIGCENIYAVVGTDEKMMFCRTLGATECINRKREDVCKRVKILTQDKGVDIIIDVSGREYHHQNLDCLSEGGSLFVTGLKSGNLVKPDFSVLQMKNIDIKGASLYALPPREMDDLLRQAQAIFWPLIDKGLVRPKVRKFSFSDVAAAHRAMEDFSVSGKVLLVLDDESESVER